MTDVVSSFEAAQILQCSADNVRRLARLGRLRPVVWTRAGRLFAKGDVERLARDKQRKANTQPREVKTPPVASSRRSGN